MHVLACVLMHVVRCMVGKVRVSACKNFCKRILPSVHSNPCLLAFVFWRVNLASFPLPRSWSER